MNIEWKKIYDLCGGNNKLSGTKFEEIVLDYLQEYYPQYNWSNTKSSWDDNRDFISLILENIWAEAKYKKDCSALKKQDIDPTMMSGFLNGNIEVIIFITNGYLPATIMDRIKLASNMCFFNIICITRTQLEYWLMLRPNKYEYYFKESLKFQAPLPSIALIKSIDIVDHLDSNANVLSIRNELFENHFYIMSITFEANECSKVLIDQNEYPFSFVNAPGYAVSTNIQISPGIQQIQLLIHTDKCEAKVIELKYVVNNSDALVFPINVNIYPNQEPVLSYTQQLIYKEEIIRLLSINSSKGQIRTIGGRKDTGKTYLLRDILYHFQQTRQTSYFRFYSKNDYRNKIMICRLIIFINFGEIIKIFNKEFTDSSIDFYRTLLKKQFDSIGGNIDLILEVFSGCYDETTAIQVIDQLVLQENIIEKIIIPKKTPVSHLVLIDQTNYISADEFKVIRKIIDQSITCNNTCFLLTEPQNNKGVDYELLGLSLADIEYSLKSNFEGWSDSFTKVFAKEFNNNPATFSESIQYLKIFLKGISDESLLSNYLLIADEAKENKLIELDRNLEKKYLSVLGLIYTFEEGISKNILYDLGITINDINYLTQMGYIKIEYPNITSLSSLYRTLFLKRYESDFRDSVLNYLQKILSMPRKYGDEIFLPEVYTFYCRYKKINIPQFSEEILKKLRTFAYHCDYKKLYAYGNIAYYFIACKPISELTEYDYIAMFYYGISLLHMDRKRGAIEIFRKIKNNAPKNLDVYYMAASELFNNLYNLFQIAGLDAEILIVKMDLERKIRKISIESESLQSTLDLRIAYSTCLNRYMMIMFMQDAYDKAENIFCDFFVYANKIPGSIYINKYESMIGEWYLDCARGLLYIYPETAKLLLERSKIKINKYMNEKRYILANLDLAFLKCSYYGEFESEIDKIHSIVICLKEKGFYNEYIRGIIRENLCRIIYYFQNDDFINSKGAFHIINTLKEEALKAELDTMVYLRGRLAYHVRGYFAALETLLGNYTSALVYLNQNLEMVKEAGVSYKKLIIHNINHIKEITSIKWGYKLCKNTPNTYLVDPRIW